MPGRRREPIPFAFVAEAERFRGDEPPPREQASRAEIARRALLGLFVTAGLVGSVLFGLPALQVADDAGTAQHKESGQGR